MPAWANRSKLPPPPEEALFPNLATFTPPAASTKAATVEVLKCAKPLPPGAAAVEAINLKTGFEGARFFDAVDKIAQQLSIQRHWGAVRSGSGELFLPAIHI